MPNIKEEFLVECRRNEAVAYKRFDDFKEAEKFLENIEIGTECTIYKAVAHKSKYMTLREYIEEHENGAYHTFVFDIGGIHIRVISVWDFEKYYNKELLDRFNVVADNEKSYGDNCENYSCEHNLTLEMISADK